MRIAVVGTGISGLVAAWVLSRSHEVEVFEADDRVGGHTNTVRVSEGDRELAIDTGFIVFNDRTYPNFIKLLGMLNVPARDSTMSFAVRCDRTGLEYNGTTINSLFAQRSNLLSPGFYGMIRDILRFNREAPEAVSRGERRTLGAFLQAERYGQRFTEHYILPMAAAIWSAPRSVVLEFPMEFFVRFFSNHGMLSVNDRPIWKTVAGGSCAYVEKIMQHLGPCVQTRTPVRSIRRHDAGVSLTTDAAVKEFDHVILACHSDQARVILSDPSDAERDILGAIPYQANDTVLHTDQSLLPTRRLAWAAWNYHIAAASDAPVAVTYNMTMLQGLPTNVQYLVSLNCSERIDPAKVLRRFTYHHPVFSVRGVAAQDRHAEISGMRRTHYCGAYWGNGFHEDGVKSALVVCRALGMNL